MACAFETVVSKSMELYIYFDIFYKSMESTVGVVCPRGFMVVVVVVGQTVYG
jgi:hypothetical protein